MSLAFSSMCFVTAHAQPITGVSDHRSEEVSVGRDGCLMDSCAFAASVTCSLIIDRLFSCEVWRHSWVSVAQLLCLFGELVGGRRWIIARLFLCVEVLDVWDVFGLCLGVVPGAGVGHVKSCLDHGVSRGLALLLRRLFTVLILSMYILTLTIGGRPPSRIQPSGADHDRCAVQLTNVLALIGGYHGLALVVKTPNTCRCLDNCFCAHANGSLPDVQNTSVRA